jgi:hypothetical protein
VTERPILFSDAMVRAIITGRKTQTRRLVRPRATAELAQIAPGMTAEQAVNYCHTGNEWREQRGTWFFLDGYRNPAFARCPFGAPGDRLWVREAWSPIGPLSECTSPRDIWFRATAGEERHAPIKYRPSIHMPRWACRLELVVTGVRVERLHAITDEDARAEGIVRGDFANHREDFASLWELINGKRAPWASNPWVWVVSFRQAA